MAFRSWPKGLALSDPVSSSRALVVFPASTLDTILLARALALFKGRTDDSRPSDAPVVVVVVVVCCCCCCCGAAAAAAVDVVVAAPLPNPPKTPAKKDSPPRRLPIKLDSPCLFEDGCGGFSGAAEVVWAVEVVLKERVVERWGQCCALYV